MHLLGHHLPDHKLARIALTSFYGISYKTSERLLARLQINKQALISSLTEAQITALSAYLSSPSTSVVPPPQPLAGPSSLNEVSIPQSSRRRNEDPLNNLKIETDLRRSLQSDIGHHRVVGTYRGRRHAFGLPVRGQNTRSNAHTAKKLNRIERRHFSVISSPSLHSDSSFPVPQPPSWLSQLSSSFRSLA